MSRNLLENLLETSLELLYPTTCVLCGTIWKEGLCDACKEAYPFIEEPRCKKCGKPIGREEQEYCGDCAGKDVSYEQGKSLWIHTKDVSRSLYAFKYKNRRIYARTYAKELYRRFERVIREWEVDLIAPIPIHKKRKRSRGYNQAALLSKELGRLAHIEECPDLLLRKKNTKPQKALSRKERKKNLQDAFALRPGKKVKGKTVLLIDDIYTTGNTIDAAANVLLVQGAQKVYFLTISIGQGF